MATTSAFTAKDYVRVSDDKSGVQRSPAEQHEDHTATCERQDWRLAGTYWDVGSASGYATKERDDWARLIKDLNEDTFNAQILMVWVVSRGGRLTEDWLLLIKLCRLRGVKIWVHTHYRLYDMENARDRKTLRDEASGAEYAADEISASVRRAAARDAAAGKPHGRILYGYKRTYDSRTGKFVSQEPNPQEAKVVRELFRLLKAGHSLRSIAKKFNARGWRTRTGLPWTDVHLRGLALNPAYAGLRVHDPARWANGHGGSRPTAAAVTTKAAWPALVKMETFLTVRAMLTDSAQRTHRDGRAKHLLSGIAQCGVCGSILNALDKPDDPHYRCRTKGCVRVKKPDLEKLALRVMWDYLSREDNYDAFTQLDTSELEQVNKELAEARAEHDALASAEISVALAAKKEPAILKRIATLEAREKELRTPAVLLGDLAPGPDIEARWHAAPVTARRAAARTLLSPGILGRLLVMPTVRERDDTGRYQANVHVPVGDRVVFRRERPDGSAYDLEASLFVIESGERGN